MKKDIWNALKRQFGKIVTGQTGKNVRIIDMPRGAENEIGYATPTEIALNAYHPLMNELKEDEQKMLISGVFAHELMHKLISDFVIMEQKIKRYPISERSFIAEINNVIEDPAIENFAPQYIGGWLYKALKYSIAFFYKKAHPLEESKFAYSQFINALIQYGDMGLIKGNFTFEEAKDAFKKALPLVSKAIEEPDALKRFEYAEEVFEISRPLWQPLADRNELMQELSKMMSDMGKSNKSGSGSNGSNPSDDGECGDEKKKKRRNITIKKISKEEAEEMGLDNEGSSGPLPDEGDITVYVVEDDEKESNDDSDGNDGIGIDSDDKEDSDENSSSSSSSSENADNISEENETSDSSNGKDTASDGEETNKSSEAGDNSDSENSKDGQSDENSSDSQSSSSNEANGNEESNNSSEDKHSQQRDSASETDFHDRNVSGSTPEYSEGTDMDDAEFDEGDYDFEDDEYDFTDEDISAIEKEIERSKKEVEQEALIERDDDISSEDLEVGEITGNFGPVRCINKVVNNNKADDLAGLYNAQVEVLRPCINTLTKQLKRIFINDVEEKEYRTSGQINMKRLYGSTVTSRLFDRRISPKNKSDIAVVILVDESGSMSGSSGQGMRKCEAAKLTCISLVETFDKLNIPVSTIGFTTSGDAAVHFHYLNWKTSETRKQTLLKMTAHASNFDGYSIRYAGKLLKKRKEQHKLFIVISDGAPACYQYRTTEIGVSDTKNAISEVSKFSSVIGVGVGNTDTRILHSMYGNSFLHISNVNDLTTSLAKVVKNTIKKW